MKRIEVMKLYQGCADIRDYVVRECIDGILKKQNYDKRRNEDRSSI